MSRSDLPPHRAGEDVPPSAAAPGIRPGAPADAATLAALAVQVFLDTYATDGVRPDLAREAFATYSADAFAHALAERDRCFLLAERGGALVGFAEARLCALPAPAGGVVGAELVRLYVQPRFQRRGIGRHLLAAAQRAALWAGLDTVWLTAWEGNDRARRFYGALGYQDVGATAYSFEGASYANRVFAKRLDPGERLPGAVDAPTP